MTLYSSLPTLALGLLLVGTGALSASAPAQVSDSRQTVVAPKPATAARGTTESIAKIQARRFVSTRPLEKDDSEHYPDRTRLPQAPGAIASATFPYRIGDSGVEANSESVSGSRSPGVRRGGPKIALSTGFVGTLPSETPYTPPDTQADVSPTQVLIGVNGRIKVYSKTGTLGALNTDIDNFFLSVAGSGGISDPRVRWDRQLNRWIVIAISLESTNNKVVIAVSNSATIDASTTFSFFSFNQSIGGGVTTQFADYPTLGVDRNALYIGTNQFTNTFAGSDLFVVRKSSLVAGGSPVVTHFRSLCGASTAGPYTPQGVDNDDPAATEGYVIGVDNVSAALLQLRRISDPGGSPTISGNVPLTVQTTATAADTPQPSTTSRLDTLDDRLFLARICLNSLTGARTLWTSHNIGVGANGVAAANGRAGGRWYQIQGFATGATPSLVQSGTTFDSAATNPNYVFIPSIVQNLQGHALMGSSYGGAAVFTGARSFVRLSSDTLGTLPQQFQMVSGTGSYTQGRWGDYSMATVDPTDGMTFWTFQEYALNSTGYSVWAQRVLSDAPVASSLSVTSLRRGQSGTGALTGTGFFDPPASYPNHLAASATGTGLTLVPTFVSPTLVNLSLSVGANAPLGARTITLANPDGQITTTAFTVLAPLFSGTVAFGDYPQTAKPPVTVEFLDAAGNSLLTTTVTPASDGTISLEPDLPAGVYTVRVRSSHFLRRAVTGVDASSGTVTFSASLINGDVNNDNTITVADVNAVRSALGSSVGDPGYNPDADLNGDGTVSIADVNILRPNLGLSGD